VRGKPKSLRSSGQPSQSKFVQNSWYEALLKRWQDQPQQFARTISAGTQRCLQIYAEQKERAAKKPHIHRAVK
jgi:hypothetical protein